MCDEGAHPAVLCLAGCLAVSWLCYMMIQCISVTPQHGVGHEERLSLHATITHLGLGAVLVRAHRLSGNWQMPCGLGVDFNAARCLRGTGSQGHLRNVWGPVGNQSATDVQKQGKRPWGGRCWSERYKQTLFLNIVTHMRCIDSRSRLAAHLYVTHVKSHDV